MYIPVVGRGTGALNLGEGVRGGGVTHISGTIRAAAAAKGAWLISPSSASLQDAVGVGSPSSRGEGERGGDEGRELGSTGEAG